jgi:macrodomain Ter protein organizer (MatP/YcbG family)
VSDDDLPPTGRLRKYVAVHLPRGVFQRARGLARQRGVTVSDLIEDMINQRVDAEEARLRAAGS